MLCHVGRWWRWDFVSWAPFGYIFLHTDVCPFYNTHSACILNGLCLMSEWRRREACLRIIFFFFLYSSPFVAQLWRPWAAPFSLGSRSEIWVSAGGVNAPWIYSALLSPSPSSCLVCHDVIFKIVWKAQRKRKRERNYYPTHTTSIEK